jgi:hypothetical protein
MIARPEPKSGQLPDLFGHTEFPTIGELPHLQARSARF